MSGSGCTGTFKRTTMKCGSGKRVTCGPRRMSRSLNGKKGTCNVLKLHVRLGFWVVCIAKGEAWVSH